MFQPKPASSAEPLQSMPRLPQVVVTPVPPAVPVLVRTKKELPLALPEPPKTDSKAPTSVETKTPEGFTPPPLERVSKPSNRSQTNPAGLRPSWPVLTKTNPSIDVDGQTVARRVEDPHGMYFISTEVHSLSVAVGTEGQPVNRLLLHGVYSFDKVMGLPGDGVTKKLIDFAMEKVIPSTLPSFLKTGIGIGTAEIVVEYPVTSSNPDLVATITIRRTVEGNVQPSANMKYRTVTIRRIKPNMTTSIEI